MQEELLSMDQMMAVLDNAPVAIYVNEIDNWKLIYANHLAQKFFLQQLNGQEITCYRAAGFDRPCSFCCAGTLSRSELLVREFHHPMNGRIYQFSGKIIDWGGKPAHIEYIVDITERKREEEESEALRRRLQATFSNIPCGLCVYRLGGGRVFPIFHNPAFYEIMGYSEDHIREAEQETSFLGVHPEDIPALQQKIQGMIRCNGMVQHTYRVWNDRKGEYRSVHLDGTIKPQQDGTKLLYSVYTDVSEQLRLEKELTDANEKMQDIVNAIPGGVAIYRVSDIFETIYFSDGVPELTGYSVEEYRELIKQDVAKMIYWEDAAMVVARAKAVIQCRGFSRFEFRKQHRAGHIVWVRIQIKWIGEDKGCPLLHCVFHNISDLKEAQSEMNHLINFIPGGIASYRIEGGRFAPLFCSDGVMALSGHTREEYREVVRENPLAIVYEPDRERVVAAGRKAIQTGETLDISYRMRHKDGTLIWIHLNGRRMGPLSESARFYAVFTGMSAETRLFQSIANETADGIYVIDKENYDLLYVNESKMPFTKGRSCLGQKCYAALYGKSEPCEFCTLKSHASDGEEHEMAMKGTGRFFSTRFHETDWNGIPAYLIYIRDVTDEVKTRREKERWEQYFESVLKNLPGGISVIRCEKGGNMIPEFLSDGFAAMTGMTLEEAWRLYREDAMAGVHPDDQEYVNKQMAAYIESGENHSELVYRLKKGNGGDYVWIKNNLSLIQSESGEHRVYAVYRDMTKEREEQERMRQQYKELIMQHYRTPAPNDLIVGHCNITQDIIHDIIDYTDSDLIRMFSAQRERFFTGLASFVVDPEERRTFLETFLNKPALEAFERGDFERRLPCYIQLPKEPKGRYVEIKINMVSTPDSGDITGILTVTDITEQTIADRILYQLSVTGYDFVADLDLTQDQYTILSCNEKASLVPPMRGCYSEWIAYMLQSRVVPKDRERYRDGLDLKRIPERLEKEGSYTLAFSVVDDRGDVLTKNMTVSAADLRLGRICLSRTDITDSIQEQQGLLNMIAYTFEMACFINTSNRNLTTYTREMVLKNLSPYSVENYDLMVERLAETNNLGGAKEEVIKQFQLETMIRLLEEKPAGYDFVFSIRKEDGIRYKQVNVLWGGENHRMVCLVQADVTDMLTAERQTKKALEGALTVAEEANRAKSDFLSAMSHDIRTPMNAIMGMTALATAHLDDRERVSDCLRKISVSSKHLMSLINDILDMSKIERSKITLNRMKIFLPDLIEQMSAMMAPQAREASLRFEIEAKGVRHNYFYGDSLRISQILINLLSNAIKFTPEGGAVHCLVEELDPADDPLCARYRFTISDTGIGMSEELLTHIFEPFARSRNARYVEGTGLGLSITKGLVDLMKGEISVESRAYQGTTFRVELECEYLGAELDARTDAGEARPPASEHTEIFAGRCFLVAEDNAINSEILCELLQMYGAKAVVKTDGAQTVRAFQEAAPGAFDAILLDIQMPVMNGYEAARAIRGMKRADAGIVPIIAMTANAFAEDIQASIDAGMDAHVAKPIDLEVLNATFLRLLGKNRTAEQ